jgi:uncharacterized SAM-binding protein YcdF (DUF218 family)
MNVTPPFFCGLLRRRSVPLPTWRGWLVLLLTASLVGAAMLRGACDFLTVQESAPGGVLVVEGWLAPPDVTEALAEFRRHPYLGLYVTGGPIEQGSPVDAYGTYAVLTADVLRRAGADEATLHAVPAPAVAKDRTYGMAQALKKELVKNGVATTQLNVVTSGPHARRSRLLYQRVFGPQTRVGMLALPCRNFDSARWWMTSDGFRTVTGELIAYLYARFIFTPPRD